MPRIRTIKPEFWSSEQVVECSPNARLLFIGMWNFCDDGGVMPDSVKTIKMRIFPGDDFTGDMISTWLNELIKNTLIIHWNSGDNGYYFVTGWHHQKVEKPSFKYPQFADHSPTIPRTLIDRPPAEKEKEKEKEKEGNKKGRNFDFQENEDFKFFEKEKISPDEKNISIEKINSENVAENKIQEHPEKPENGINADPGKKEKISAKKEKKQKTPEDEFFTSAHSLIKAAFLKFHLEQKRFDYTWTAKDAGQVKPITRCIMRVLIKSDSFEQTTPEAVCAYFVKIITAIPGFRDSFYWRKFTISHISSSINEIINIIRNGESSKRGQRTNSSAVPARPGPRGEI